MPVSEKNFRLFGKHGLNKISRECLPQLSEQKAIAEVDQVQKVTYPLSTLLFVSICGIFRGASSWDDWVLFTETRQDWLHQYVDLSSGTPCASTFRRLFAIMDTNKWNELMTATLGVVLPHPVPIETSRLGSGVSLTIARSRLVNISTLPLHEAHSGQ